MNFFTRIRLIHRTLGRAFGLWLLPAIPFVLWSVLRGTMWVFMTLDVLISPKLRRVKIESPIVIVGNPRSGTTFLQRFLSSNGVGASLELWRMVYPSLIVQTVIQKVGLLPLLERVSPAKYHSTAAHETSLTSVETDDAALTTRFLDGYFLYAFVLAWADEDLRPRFDPALRNTMARDARWLRRVWRRNLVATGSDRVLAKHFSLTDRVPQFLEEFPDARILYMVRDPVEVIPSAMSLVTGVAERPFKIWDLPEEKRARYFERLYRVQVDWLRGFHDDYVSGRIPRDRVLVVVYDRMMSDFEAVMNEILSFTGTDASAEFQQLIAERAEKQRAYRSKHRYDLAKFGLDEKRIREDCAFVYETFGVGVLPS